MSRCAFWPWDGSCEADSDLVHNWVGEVAIRHRCEDLQKFWNCLEKLGLISALNLFYHLECVCHSFLVEALSLHGLLLGQTFNIALVEAADSLYDSDWSH